MIYWWPNTDAAASLPSTKAIDPDGPDVRTNITSNDPGPTIFAEAGNVSRRFHPRNHVCTLLDAHK